MKCTNQGRPKFHGWVMIALWAIVIACGSESSAPEDAGPVDSGVTFVCGNDTCVAGDQYCLQEPTGRCEARTTDCGPGEATCTDNGSPGCGPVRLGCVALPAGCASCPCLIASDACGTDIVNFNCSSSGDRTDVRCPF